MEVRVGDLLSRDEIAAMREELRGGASIEEVAARHGIPQPIIDRFLTCKSGKSRKPLLWSDEEVEFLRENFPKHGSGWVGWTRGLPNRSWGAIARKATSLGVKGTQPRIWTEYEIEYLRENYREHGLNWDGWKVINRSKRAVLYQAGLNGLTDGAERWTDEETEFVRKNYLKHGRSWGGWQWLQRSYGAIVSKANRMGLIRRDKKG